MAVLDVANLAALAMFLIVANQTVGTSIARIVLHALYVETSVVLALVRTNVVLAAWAAALNANPVPISASLAEAAWICAQKSVPAQ